MVVRIATFNITCKAITEVKQYLWYKPKLGLYCIYRRIHLQNQTSVKVVGVSIYYLIDGLARPKTLSLPKRKIN